MTKSVYVIGAGGHAKVVIRAVTESGYKLAGIFDDALSMRGNKILGIPVLGTTNDIHKHDHYPAVIAIGDNRIRQAIANRLKCEWLSVVHPSAVVDSTVKLGPGTVVMAGAIIQVDAVIQDHVIINTGSSVDHDCEIRSFAHVAPGAHLAGNCRIGAGTLIGVGASVIPGIHIGSSSVIGAGAAVVSDIGDEQTAVGVPARCISKDQIHD